MRKQRNLILTCIMVMAVCGASFADNVIYTPDALILPADGIAKIRIDEVLGSTGVNDDWPDGNPDGYVVKSDSPYFTTAKYGGQDKLSKDMQTNSVKKYPNYEANPWRGKSWEKTPAYWQMAAHLEKPLPDALIAWTIQIQDEVESTAGDFNDWLLTRDKNGYDDNVVAEFIDGQIVVNTKYMFGPIETSTGVHFRPSGSDGPGIAATLYVPLANKAARDKFVVDFAAWQSKPKLTKTIDTQNTVEYVR